MLSRREFLLTSLATSATAITGCRRSADVSRSADCGNSAECYTRMFPQLARPPHAEIEEGLRKLGELMEDDDSGDNSPTVTAGYTYFGQFIDHDLTLDITPLEEAHPAVEQIRNLRTPSLDLDHVYAGGPTVSPFLYDANSPHEAERFLVGGMCDRANAGVPKRDDLPRNANGIALVGDPRQDENLIIAQLHVAFLKFHNRVITELAKSKQRAVESVGPAGASLFRQAQQLVQWHYQYVVINDFLASLVRRDILDQALQPSKMRPAAPSNFRMPVEFSAAAFRFGHSMVRDVYGFFNDDHFGVDLRCLLALTGPGSKHIAQECDVIPCASDPSFALPSDWKIDWSHFFMLSEHRPQVNAARKIDIRIARGLHNLKLETVKQFNKAVAQQGADLVPPTNRLPVRTLWRGARMGLPTGQDVAKELHFECLDSDSQIATGTPEQVLREYGLHRETPLWYYVLKEAELLGWTGPNGHQQLGPVGSRIVAEVVIGAIRACPDSYLVVNPSWQPTLAGKPVTTIGNILEFVAAGDA